MNIDQKQKNFENLEKRIYDLENLIGLGISLSSNLEFESLVESILYSCIGQMFVEKVAILLQVDIDLPNYYIHMAKGYDIKFDNSNVILKDRSPLIRFLENDPVPYEFINLNEIEDLKKDLSKIQSLEPKLIVPMKSKDLLNGMIILGDKFTGEDFSLVEKKFIQDLAKFAAIAVENSRLYLMATLDRMTRLYIHHYFQERLLEEMRRCSRKKSPLSLIMCDIDHFKTFNDNYGHQQGDIVLKEVARILKNSLRSVDIAARYGGEEFAVILPDTDIKSAAIIAERLRCRVEEYEFPGQDKPLHVTASLGVAQYNEILDKTKDDLIKRTDMALYRAKNDGRNLISVDEK